MKNHRGIALIIACFVLVVLLVLAAAFAIRGVQERDLTHRQREDYEAFNLAEAALDRAVVGLRNDFSNWSAPNGNISFGSGEYSIAVGTVSPTNERKVNCIGYMPSAASYRQKVEIEAYIRETIPDNFYNNAIYSAGDVVIHGNSHLITGDVRYGGSIDSNVNITDGTATGDSTISPLARLDFNQLYSISSDQGNVYDAARLQSEDLPTSFWYDEAEGVPNVVYVESDLTVHGNTTIGGFLVVAGDVINNTDAEADTTISGNVAIEGAVYTLGDYTVHGGGHALNVDGGVWTADDFSLHGNVDVQYNQTYMEAIETLNIDPEAQIVSWRQVEN